MAPPEVETSTEPALTIDTWMPKPSPRPPAPTPEAPPALPPTSTLPVSPPAAAAPKVTEPVAPPAPVQAAPAAPVPSSMNEMKGVISSIDMDARVVVLTVEGGYNPQFNVDSKTTVFGGGQTLQLSDLTRGNSVVIRYIGKEMTAREIEKTPGHPVSRIEP